MPRAAASATTPFALKNLRQLSGFASQAILALTHALSVLSMTRINATTACFPGFTVRAALNRITAGIEEPVIGALCADHIQVCPQNFGQVDEAEAEALREAFPGSQLRLHANARVLPHHVLFDASTVRDHSLPYFRALADRSHRLGASVLSIHAGNAENASLSQMFDNVRALQDGVFGDIRLAIEGLYPHDKRPQLLGTWAEYETLLRSELPFALDLSHLNIVCRHEGERIDLVRDLLASDRCLEVHTSGNDGRRDEHALLTGPPWWLPLLEGMGRNAIAFSESNQTRAMRPAKSH